MSYPYLKRSVFKAINSNDYTTDITTLSKYFTLGETDDKPPKLFDTGDNKYTYTISVLDSSKGTTDYTTDLTGLRAFFTGTNKDNPPYHDVIVLGTGDYALTSNDIDSNDIDSTLITSGNDYWGSLLKTSETDTHKILLFKSGYIIYNINDKTLPLYNSLTAYTDDNYINYRTQSNKLLIGTLSTDSIFLNTIIETLFIRINIESIQLNETNIINDYTITRIDDYDVNIYKVSLKDGNTGLVLKDDTTFDTVLLSDLKNNDTEPKQLKHFEINYGVGVSQINNITHIMTEQEKLNYVWTEHMKCEIFRSLKRWDEIIIDNTVIPFTGDNAKIQIDCNLEKLTNQNALAIAGPTIFKYSGDNIPRTTKGRMIFNINYYNISDNQNKKYYSNENDTSFLHDIAIHEIGHILGIGISSFWENITTNTIDDNGKDKTLYTGTNACKVYKHYHSTDSLKLTKGGQEIDTKYKNSTYPSVKNTHGIPVEDNGGPISAGSHIEEGEKLFYNDPSLNNMFINETFYPAFGNEIMTAFSNNLMPMSALTLAMLEDLNYTVDYTKADAFEIDESTSGLESYMVTYNNGKYYINGIEKAIITLYRGRDYKFMTLQNNTYNVNDDIILRGLNISTINGSNLDMQLNIINESYIDWVKLYIILSIGSNTPDELLYFNGNAMDSGGSIRVFDLPTD